MNVLFDRATIQARIARIAEEITIKHHKDKTSLVFICLLNGGYMFFSDLTKEIMIPMECEFMRVKSYVSKNKQGDIQITKDVETLVKDKHVYIVDDIFDTGNTMKAVVEYLAIKNPESINIVTLLKRSKSQHDPTQGLGEYFIDSFRYGFEINDEWVVGYGMDREDGTGRNIPGILAI
jgi:hypoxanthine phosphoribosyltransferase